jgi:hypothetical protein
MSMTTLELPIRRKALPRLPKQARNSHPLHMCNPPKLAEHMRCIGHTFSASDAHSSIPILCSRTLNTSTHHPRPRTLKPPLSFHTCSRCFCSRSYSDGDRSKTRILETQRARLRGWPVGQIAPVGCNPPCLCTWPNLETGSQEPKPTP